MKRQKTTAFTLVELMAALIVISILAGMVVAALSAASGSARKARAQAQLLAIHQVIAQRMEEYITRRMPDPGSDQPMLVGYQLQGPEANRSRLILLRQLMRFELPDRKNDLIWIAPSPNNLNPPPTMQRAWIRRDQAGNVSVDLQQPFSIFRSAPPAFTRYQDILNSLTGNNIARWTEQFEGSETLYLILATSQVGGRSALEILPADQVRDTDGDGVPEILDPWGVPIIWIRWPVGYWLTYADRSDWLRASERERRLDMQSSMERAGSDQFDILESDWRNLDSDWSSPDGNTYRNDTFNIQPVVVSAGPDGEFDLMLRSSDPNNSAWRYGVEINYGFMDRWPTNGQMTEVPTYGGVPAVDDPYVSRYYYIDPYAAFNHSVDYAKEPNPFTQNHSAGLPGAYYDANDNRSDESTDNIYSVSAQ